MFLTLYYLTSGSLSRAGMVFAAVLKAMSDEPVLVVLAWLISGGGAGVVTYKLMQEIKPYLSGWESKHKRYLSLLIAALVGAAAYACLVVLKFEPMPADVREWILRLFAAAWTATGVSQAIHGARHLTTRSG